ncbi:MAG: hypothetical protein HYX61_04600 [Gammaproteobacteria bacterium]|jgi:hypothetical protein|nr:hypothetical protein [Gammaproteobacteria bacterium]
MAGQRPEPKHFDKRASEVQKRLKDNKGLFRIFKDLIDRKDLKQSNFSIEYNKEKKCFEAIGKTRLGLQSRTVISEEIMNNLGNASKVYVPPKIQTNDGTAPLPVLSTPSISPLPLTTPQTKPSANTGRIGKIGDVNYSSLPPAPEENPPLPSHMGVIDEEFLKQTEAASSQYQSVKPPVQYDATFPQVPVNNPPGSKVAPDRSQYQPFQPKPDRTQYQPFKATTSTEQPYSELPLAPQDDFKEEDFPEVPTDLSTAASVAQAQPELSQGTTPYHQLPDDRYGKYQDKETTQNPPTQTPTARTQENHRADLVLPSHRLQTTGTKQPTFKELREAAEKKADSNNNPNGPPPTIPPRKK